MPRECYLTHRSNHCKTPIEPFLGTEVSKGGAATLSQITPIPEASIYLSPVLRELRKPQSLASLGLSVVADSSDEIKRS